MVTFLLLPPPHHTIVTGNDKEREESRQDDTGVVGDKDDSHHQRRQEADWMEIIDIKQDSLEAEDILDIDTDDRDTNRKLWSGPEHQPSLVSDS